MVQLFLFGRWASHGQRFMNIFKSFSTYKNNKVLDTTWKRERKKNLIWRREVSNLFSRLRTGRQTLCQPNQIHHNSLQMNQNCRKGGQNKEGKRKRERSWGWEHKRKWDRGGAWGAGRSAQTACREHVSGGWKETCFLITSVNDKETINTRLRCRGLQAAHAWLLFSLIKSFGMISQEQSKKRRAEIA